MNRATDIPITSSGLSVNCGTDGTWLHFKASGGKHASISIDHMIAGDSLSHTVLRQWCADRQEQARQIREAAP